MKLHKQKYKSKTLLGRLRIKLDKLLNNSYMQEVMVKHDVDLESYEYLNRHLVKLNKALNGVSIITLNKSKRNDAYTYTAVITLRIKK